MSKYQIDMEEIAEAASSSPELLTSWEIDFMESISDMEFVELSERQQDTLLQIKRKLRM